MEEESTVVRAAEGQRERERGRETIGDNEKQRGAKAAWRRETSGDRRLRKTKERKYATRWSQGKFAAAKI